MIGLTYLLLMVASVHAHYRFPKLIVNGTADAKEWTYVRQTKGYQGNQGVTDVSGADIRCQQMKPGTATASVVAGDTLGFVAMAQISHFGPLQWYMARVPDGQDVNTWDGAGNVWFKVASIGAVQGAGGLTSSESTWPAYKKSEVSFKIPKSIPDGNYLVRIESIALHQAANPGGAQIYLSCAQVKITGGGNGKPGPLTSFPGAYKASDSGLLWSYYPVRTSYTPPGPPVWEG